MIPGVSAELERILEAGNSAPSGENCQPWKFRVQGNTVDLYLLPERDQSAYGWGHRASYLACGAVLENISIAASVERWRAGIQLFPDPQNPLWVATIVFTPDASTPRHPLAPFISARISNRKPYKKDALTSEERAALLAASNAMVLIEKPEEIQKLGQVGATNERIMLANKSLHNFFFSHVSWTKEEDEKNKIGFYIKTLELPPPAEKMFKLFSRWSAMRMLAALGFNRVVAAQNASTNASAAAMGGFTVSAIDPIDFVNLGREVERVWITAASLGLSFQPLTGVLFFRLKIVGGAGDSFSPQEKALIESAYSEAASVFKAGGSHVAFMFRIGHADAPSAHAIRFPLQDVVMAAS